jgi:signal transduction histidine kinase
MGHASGWIRGWIGRSERRARARAVPSVPRAVVQFALSGLAAVAVLGFVAVQILQHTGESEAIRDAKHETQLAGRGIVTPQLRAALLSGDGAAVARLDRVVRRYVLRDPVVRVKLWDASGRILYSDQHELIGSRYRLGADELAALRSAGVAAEVSDLTKPENRFERHFSKLLEVYLGIPAPDGQPLLYEEYLRYSSVAASGNRLWSSFGPALIGTLLLLELAQIPLAWSLARRLRRRQQEREILLRRAIDASDTERRRIASELHDGAVQNLVGVSYALSAAAAGSTTQEGAQAIERAAAETRDTIRELRTLLVDIYPPTLRRAGLAGAISDLTAPLGARDVEVDIDVQPDLGLGAEQESILYRVAQEAVRNVAKHSGASQLRIEAARDNGLAFLSVHDNGRGFEPLAAKTPDHERHFGLRILDDLARDAGARLTVASAPGAGTTVRIEVPRR